ncbi:DUF2970 domain-containing protein [uncultured Shewanella sp.]|uniref:DUF2970 domain-containing protein n=1 Tax=uncultured Shewanella sp. TaxID=173975 RepID=UPI00262ADF2D|nr:DUF2970 domain-containing protein [uncultured Shewanella sp.]
MLKNFWHLLISTLAAFFGVQSEQNRVRDFQTKSIVPFIIMGVFIAIIFVGSLLFIVTQVLG